MKEQSFGKKLIEVRKAKGLTQDEVAEMCNITVRTIQRIESESVIPRAFTVKAISDVLGFDFFETSDTGYDVKENQDSNPKKRTILWYIKDLFNLKTNAMKKVSILSTFFLTVGFALFFFVSETNAQSLVDKDKKSAKETPLKNYTVNKDLINIRFTPELTFDSLVYIKNDLKNRGITINYKMIKFDENYKLSAISCEMDCNDGFKGSFTSDPLIVKNKKDAPGFYRDYSEKSESPFGTGAARP